MTFNTKGRSGPSRKKVTVETNDPDNPKIFLHLAGHINVLVAVEPKRLTLGRQLAKSQKATEEFSITVKNNEISIASITVPNDDRFEVNFKSGDPKKDGVYELAFKGGDKLGVVTAELLIKLEGSEKEIKTAIRFQILGDLRYSKNLFFFKKDNSFEPREVTFSTRSGKQTTITSAEDPTNTLKLEIVKSKDKATVVRATVIDTKASYKKPKRGKFTVKTTDPDEPQVEITYMISERRAPSMQMRPKMASPNKVKPLIQVKK